MNKPISIFYDLGEERNNYDQQAPKPRSYTWIWEKFSYRTKSFMSPGVNSLKFDDPTKYIEPNICDSPCYQIK